MKRIILLAAVIVGCKTYNDYIVHDNACAFDNNIFNVQESEFFFSHKTEDLSLLETVTINDSISYYKYPDTIIVLNKISKKNNIKKNLIYHINSKKLISVFFTYLNQEIHEGYDFDSNGTVKDTIDYRQTQNYPICYREALNIVEAKKGKKDSITGLSLTTYTKNNTLHYVWEVFTEVPEHMGGGQSRFYRIDAQTGKLITRGTTSISANDLLNE